MPGGGEGGSAADRCHWAGAGRDHRRQEARTGYFPRSSQHIKRDHSHSSDFSRVLKIKHKGVQQWLKGTSFDQAPGSLQIPEVSVGKKVLSCAAQGDVAATRRSCSERWICADLSQPGHQWDNTQGHICTPGRDAP